MDEYQEVFGISEEPEALPEGGENEREAAGPAPEKAKTTRASPPLALKDRKRGRNDLHPAGTGLRRESGVRAFAKRTSNLTGFTPVRLVRSRGPPTGALRPAGRKRSGTARLSCGGSGRTGSGRRPCSRAGTKSMQISLPDR